MVYDTDITKKHLIAELILEVIVMRHVYIRGIFSIIWLAAAIISALSGSFETAALYIVLGGIFFHSAYTMWRREKDPKGDR